MSMSACLCLHAYVCMFMSICLCLHVYDYMSMSTCLCLHVYVYMSTCLCLHVYFYTSMSACLRVYISISLYSKVAIHCWWLKNLTLQNLFFKIPLSQYLSISTFTIYYLSFTNYQFLQSFQWKYGSNIDPLFFKYFYSWGFVFPYHWWENLLQEKELCCCS